MGMGVLIVMWMVLVTGVDGQSDPIRLTVLEERLTVATGEEGRGLSTDSLHKQIENANGGRGAKKMHRTRESEIKIWQIGGGKTCMTGK